MSFIEYLVQGCGRQKFSPNRGNSGLAEHKWFSRTQDEPKSAQLHTHARKHKENTYHALVQWWFDPSAAWKQPWIHGPTKEKMTQTYQPPTWGTHHTSSKGDVGATEGAEAQRGIRLKSMCFGQATLVSHACSIQCYILEPAATVSLPYLSFHLYISTRVASSTKEVSRNLSRLIVLPLFRLLTYLFCQDILVCHCYHLSIIILRLLGCCSLKSWFILEIYLLIALAITTSLWKI
jgi:hypothetical protein